LTLVDVSKEVMPKQKIVIFEHTARAWSRLVKINLQPAFCYLTSALGHRSSV